MARTVNIQSRICGPNIFNKKILFKDARSVSLYPYNRSSIFKYLKYTKLIEIVKGIANFCDK